MTTHSAERSYGTSVGDQSTRLNGSITAATIATRFGILLCLLFVGAVFNLVSFSSFSLSLSDAWQALFHFNSNQLSQQVIRTLRVPRLLTAMTAGAGLAVAGVLMQGLTRNPLASPSLFGIGYGAALAFTLSATGFIPFLNVIPVSVVCFLGALITGLIMFFLAGLHLSRMNPIRMVLAGVAMNFLLVSVVRGLVIFADDHAFGVYYWLIGNISNATFPDIWMAIPPIFLGLVIAVYISHPLNLLSLGEERMQSLGGSLTPLRLLSGLAITLLTGASVSIAGPIGFVGLMVPHIGRRIVGHDHRILIPFSALMGAILLVFSDILARSVNFPIDTPIGIVTALLGAPFFFYLACRKTRGQ